MVFKNVSIFLYETWKWWEFIKAMSWNILFLPTMESKCLLGFMFLGTLCMRQMHLGLLCRSMLGKQPTCWTFLSTSLPTVLTSPVSNHKKKPKAIRSSGVVSNTWNNRKCLWDVKIEVTANAAYRQPWWVQKFPYGY